MISATILLDLRGLEDVLKQVEQPTASGPFRDMLVQWAARYRGFAQRRFDKYSKGGGDWAPLKPATIAARRQGSGKKLPTYKRKAFKKVVKARKVASISGKLAKLSARIRKAKSQSSADTLRRKRENIRTTHGVKKLNARNAKNTKLSQAKAAHAQKENTRKLSIFAKRRLILSNAKVAILRDMGLLFAALNPVLNTQGGIQRIEGLFSIVVGFGGPQSHPGAKGKTIADIAASHNFGLGHVPKRLIIATPDISTLAGMTKDADRALSKFAKLIG
jgi:hypothetical protein